MTRTVPAFPDGLPTSGPCGPHDLVPLASDNYDSILLLSFGGPEGPQDVMPFLENVLRGRNVPRERLLEVAEHYYHFGGVSPINAQNRALIVALREEFNRHGIDLPIYWGNRNWHPLLADALRQMRDDGLARPLAFVTSVFSSYSGCRQYLEDIARAAAEVGPNAPRPEKLRAFFNHPGFIEAMAERVAAALAEIPPDRRWAAHIVFTAHSIPAAMASGCKYEEQLREACRLVIEQLEKQAGSQEGAGMGRRAPWSLVYQSRSGPPAQPWLGPDVCDFLRELAERTDRPPAADVVLAPIGFISDHMEVMYDLDVQARQVCDELELNMVRAATVGTHPKFVSMIRELILERTAGAQQRWLGEMGPSHDVCPADCCPSGAAARLTRS